MDEAVKSFANASFYDIYAFIWLNSCKRASFSSNFAFDLSFRLKLMRFCRNLCNGVNAGREYCIFGVFSHSPAFPRTPPTPVHAPAFRRSFPQSPVCSCFSRHAFPVKARLAKIRRLSRCSSILLTEQPLV